jgi:DNA primase
MSSSGKATFHRVVAGAARRAPSGHPKGYPTGRPAGLLTPAVLESVRERAQITDLFGPTELKRSGRDFVTRCPWHDDRRPSLSVSPRACLQSCHGLESRGSWCVVVNSPMRNGR